MFFTRCGTKYISFDLFFGHSKGAWGGRSHPWCGTFAILHRPLHGRHDFPEKMKKSATNLVAHDCGYPLSRYTCRATGVAADFLDFIAFCRCSTGVALHPLKILVSHPPPAVPGGVAPRFGSEKVSRYTGVSQLQLRVSRYTVQLRQQNPRKKKSGGSKIKIRKKKNPLCQRIFGAHFPHKND